MGTFKSRVLSAEDIRNLRQWLPPDVGGSGAVLGEQHQVAAEAGSGIAEAARVETDPAYLAAPEERPRLPTAEEIEAIQQAAHQEGYDAGHQEGFEFGRREGIEAARQETQARLQLFDGLIELLDRPLRQLDDQVENELLHLVGQVARQVVRRELSLAPEQILVVLHEALDALPSSARHVRVALHPEDAALVRESYAQAQTELGWRVQEDPTLSRGGCRILSDNSRMDATLETRLGRMIESLLGQEQDHAAVSPGELDESVDDNAD
jgi:flagellar assembly protein FliH